MGERLGFAYDDCRRLLFCGEALFARLSYTFHISHSLGLGVLYLGERGDVRVRRPGRAVLRP